MTEVRVEHEDLFIAHVADSDNIPEKCHFDSNHKWVANNSDTTKVAVRKIKVSPMNLTAEIGFAINDSNSVQQYIMFHYTLCIDW
jgi:hypothetical protein